MKKPTQALRSDSAGLYDELPPVFDVETMRLYLNIGRTLAYDLCRSGEIPCVRVGERVIRIAREPFLRWLEQGGLKNTAPLTWQGMSGANNEEPNYEN